MFPRGKGRLPSAGKYPAFWKRAAVFLGASLAVSSAQAAERRDYVVSWLTQAVHSEDGDCQGGLEPSINDFFITELMKLGKTREQAEQMMIDFKGGQNYGTDLHLMFTARGRINGHSANIYDNPTSVPDPKIRTVTGKHAPGFNLDGKTTKSSFEDPLSHEKGIDNQYFRAMGCFTTHRAQAPVRPTHWSYAWDAQRAGMKAWLVSIAGEDLNKDGDVTVTIDKATHAVALDSNAQVKWQQILTVDEQARSRNVFKGKLKDGVVTIEPADFRLVGDPFVIAVWDIQNTHLRLTLNKDGSLSGMMGGYQSWLPIYHMYAQGSYAYEGMIGLNVPGIYYALRRLADAKPDPKTKQNMAISVAYRIEAVPALVIDPERPQ